MALWILADPHGGMGGESDQALLRLLSRAQDRRADLLILGDLFVAWLGPDRFHTPFQRQVLEGLAQLRAQGAQVRFVVGNRDYLPHDAPGVFDQVLEGEQRLEVGGVPTWVLHGDLAHPGDQAYRAWHALSRSRAVTYALRRAPAPLGRWLAQRVEAGLRDTNQAYKSGLLPEGALFGVGRRAQAAGCERALVGHFHHDRTLDVPDGVPVVVAPGWCEHQRILVAEPSGALRSRDLASL